MHSIKRWSLALVLCSAASSAGAQIYTCTAEDGTRVFSDERCGPDAKIVPGIATKKRTPAKVAPNRTPRSPAELDTLLEQCNSGDVKACNAWTHGGGPNRLREQEQKAGLACEGGSLVACEQRYCLDGISEQCRARVLQTAKVSGPTWYLRDQQQQPDGGIAYQIRCLTPGVREVREATVSCAGPPGPKRCALASAQQRYARLDQAAAQYCGSGGL